MMKNKKKRLNESMLLTIILLICYALELLQSGISLKQKTALGPHYTECQAISPLKFQQRNVRHFPPKWTNLNPSHYIFTALHGTQTRSSDEKAVCPSVRLSVRLTVHQTRKL